MAFDGSAIPIKQDYRFVNGYPAVEVGKTYQVIPDWVESEKKQGRIIIWEVQKETSENLISVDQNGVITAKAPGLATVSVYSKDSADSDTHYMWTYIQISVVNKMIIPLAANEKAAQIPDDIKYSSACFSTFLRTFSAHNEFVSSAHRHKLAIEKFYFSIFSCACLILLYGNHNLRQPFQLFQFRPL